MDSSEIKQLQILAAKSRMGAILGTYHAKSGHPGGSLSAADIFTYLYFKEMNVDPKNPDMQDRDRFVLSKGHCCPALYATLALKGFFEWDELTKLRHVGAMLQGHPDMKGTPGIDMSTGSLGQGISAACGKEALALGANAGKIVKAVAQKAGGNGGGKPDMAMAGAKQPEKIEEALDSVKETVYAMLK